MAAENEAATGLAVVLVEGDRSDLRSWIEWAWRISFGIGRWLWPLEGAAERSKPAEGLRKYLEYMEPWVDTWRRPPYGSQDEIRAVPATSAPRHVGYVARPFDDQRRPVDLFTEIWWKTLKEPWLAKIPLEHAS